MKHTRTGNPLVDSVAEHQPQVIVRTISIFNVSVIKTDGFMMILSKPTDSNIFDSIWSCGILLLRKDGSIGIASGTDCVKLGGIAVAYMLAELRKIFAP